jgi:hypothetical protein
VASLNSTFHPILNRDHFAHKLILYVLLTVYLSDIQGREQTIALFVPKFTALFTTLRVSEKVKGVVATNTAIIMRFEGLYRYSQLTHRVALRHCNFFKIMANFIKSALYLWFHRYK